MGFLEDFRDSVDNYVDNHVTFTYILNLATDYVAPATAGGININEVWRFKVTVTNGVGSIGGAAPTLNMTGVQLRIEGQNGATVASTAAGPFAASFNSAALLTINAHGSQTSGYFYFKAPGVVKPAGTILVKAYINAFDVNLNHLLNDHTSVESAKFGTYAGQVFI